MFSTFLVVFVNFPGWVCRLAFLTFFEGFCEGFAVTVTKEDTAIAEAAFFGADFKLFLSNGFVDGFVESFEDIFVDKFVDTFVDRFVDRLFAAIDGLNLGSSEFLISEFRISEFFRISGFRIGEFLA